MVKPVYSMKGGRGTLTLFYKCEGEDCDQIFSLLPKAEEHEQSCTSQSHAE